MKFTIRDVTPQDFPAVRALLVATWHDTYDGIYGRDRVIQVTNHWHSIDALERGLSIPDSCFLVAAVDGEIKGTASARQDCDQTIRLLRLYIAPGSQRSGLGTALLQSVHRAFPGARRITLEVEPANTKACGFYRRHGFQVTGEAEFATAWGDNFPHQIMERVL